MIWGFRLKHSFLLQIPAQMLLFHLMNCLGEMSLLVEIIGTLVCQSKVCATPRFSIGLLLKKCSPNTLLANTLTGCFGGAGGGLDLHFPQVQQAMLHTGESENHHPSRRSRATFPDVLQGCPSHHISSTHTVRRALGLHLWGRNLQELPYRAEFSQPF